MQRYKLLASLTLPAGTAVGLNDQQARDRAPLLRAQAAKGVYVATGDLSFKAGETIALEAPRNKAMATQLQAQARPQGKQAVQAPALRADATQLQAQARPQGKATQQAGGRAGAAA